MVIDKKLKDPDKRNLFLTFLRKLNLKFYDLRVSLKRKPMRKDGSFLAGEKRRLLFYMVFMVFPVAQFCVFYIGINANSLLLAFKTYDYPTGQYVFNGFDNFRNFFWMLSSSGSELSMAIGNSFKLYLAHTLIGITFSLLFSYYIYKEKLASGVFKVILFMPSIISSVVMVILFKYFSEGALPEVINLIFKTEISAGPLSNPSTRFNTLVFYSVWVGFGPGILMYTGAMSRIPPEIVESARLDGITDLKEFFYITLPLIYPTLSAFMIVGIAKLFMDQGAAYEFFSKTADTDITTIGYFLFIRVIGSNSFKDYPFASSAGIMFTLVAAPLTILVKWTLEKFDPSAEY